MYFLQGLSRKSPRQTYMSELIMPIHCEMGTRRFQRTLEDTTLMQEPRGYWAASPVGRLAPRATRQPPPHYVGSPLPPRLHLRCSLSRFDLRAHDGWFGLYKQPCSPFLSKSLKPYFISWGPKPAIKRRLVLIFLNTYRNNPQAHGITVIAFHPKVFRVLVFINANRIWRILQAHIIPL
jgi:hypothetical protein